MSWVLDETGTASAGERVPHSLMAGQLSSAEGVGSKKGTYSPICPLWAHHIPCLRRALGLHREDCHTMS